MCVNHFSTYFPDNKELLLKNFMNLDLSPIKIGAFLGQMPSLLVSI